VKEEGGEVKAVRGVGKRKRAGEEDGAPRAVGKERKDAGNKAAKSPGRKGKVKTDDAGKGGKRGEPTKPQTRGRRGKAGRGGGGGGGGRTATQR
jgi:hypothetical protein